jgi:cytochrome c oxidase cbb3-type subunit 4
MYERLAVFAQTWGLFYVIGLFAIVLAYALWPRNQKKFDRAARMPLDDDGAPRADPARDPGRSSREDD